MADRYWVGGSGTWDATTTTNWSATSGGAGGASAPTVNDDVFITTASGTGSVSGAANNACRNLTITATQALLFNSGTLNNLNGSLVMPPVGSSCVWGMQTNFRGTATGRTITTNGQTGPSNWFFNDGGDWTLIGNMTVGSTFGLLGGTFNTGNYNVTCTNLQLTGSVTRTLNCGSSTFTVSGTYDSRSATNLTLNAGTSNFIFSANNLDWNSDGRTFYDVSFTGTTQNGVRILGNNTFRNLTITPQTNAAGYKTITFSGDNIVTGTLTSLATNTSFRTLFNSSVAGTRRFLYAGAVSISNTDFQDIFATEPFTAPLGSNSLGNNTNITFNTQTLYWIGGTGNVNDGTKWSTTSGGSAANAIPGSTNSVIFNSASNATAYTVDTNGLFCNDLTMQAPAAGTVTWNGGLNLYGSLDMSVGTTGITRGSPGTITLAGNSTGKTLNFGNLTISCAVTVNGLGGAWTLQSPMLLGGGGSLTMTAGSLDTNGYTVSFLAFFANSNLPATLTLGASAINSGGISWNAVGTGFTLNAGTSTITFSYVSTSFTFNFNGGGKTYNDVVFTLGNISANNFPSKAINGANTFNNLTFSGATVNGIAAVSLAANQIVNGTLTVSNSALRRVVFYPDDFTTQRTITAAAVSLADADFIDINGAGAASWTGTRLGNGGGNSGITFPAAKTVYWNLAAGGNFISANWATSSGGTTADTNFPLAQDTAIFEDTGLNSGASITCGTAGMVFPNITYATRTLPTTLSITAQQFCPGNITVSSAVAYGGVNPILFTGNTTLTTAGVTWTNQFNIYGSLTLGSAVSASQTLTINTGGTLNLAGYNLTSTAQFSFVGGTLNLANAVYSCSIFSSNNTNTRVIQFGTGAITVTGSGTNFVNTDGVNLTYTGTPTFNVSNNSATASSVIFIGFIETNAFNVNYTTGTYSLQETAAQYRNVNYTGFAGSLGGSGRTIFGNWTNPAGLTATSSSSTTSFAATSGTQTITTNGVTLDFPIAVSGVGGTLQLGGALTLGATRTFSVLGSTLNTANFNINAGQFSISNSSSVNLGSSILTLNGTGTVWNNAEVNRFNAGTSEIILANNTTTARTFAGGGAAYNKVTVGGNTSTSTTTFSGNNYFAELASTKTVAHTLTFTQSTTSSFGLWSITGTVGNVVTINSTSTTPAIFNAKATATLNYLAVTYNTGTPGAVWIAGANSTLGTGVTGWALAAGTPRTLYWGPTAGTSTGTWDGTTVTNWYTNIGRTTQALTAPTGIDNVVFDGSSDNGIAFSVSVNTGAICQDFTASGLDNVMTLGGGAVLEIRGSLSVPASNFTRTYAGLVNFTAVTTGKTITTNGITWDSLNFNGIGGAWTLQGALTCGVITVIAGSFITNNQTILGGGFSSSTFVNPRSFTLGSSTISLSNGSCVAFTNFANLTFNAGTSQINITSAAPTFAGGTQTFYNVTMGNQVSQSNVQITQVATFNNLTLLPSSTTNMYSGFVFHVSGVVVNGTLTATGSSAIQRVRLQSNTTGTQRTIKVAACSLTDVDFRDIVVDPTSATYPLTGTRLGNQLNNAGITFSTPKTVYWNLAGTQNWTANGWATTNNGTPNVNNFPLPQDTATFTEAGAAGTVTMNAEAGIGSIQMADGISNRTTPFTLSISLSTTVYGNVTLFAGLIMPAGALNYNLFFAANNYVQTFKSNGATFYINSLQIGAYSTSAGTFRLLDNFTQAGSGAGGNITLTAGTLDLNNYTLNAWGFNSSTGNIRTIAFGTGVINTQQTAGGTVWNSSGTNLTVTGSRTVNINNSSANNINISATNGTQDNTLDFNITAGTGVFSLSGVCAFRSLNFTGFAGTFAGPSTYSIFGSLTLSTGMTYTNTSTLQFTSTTTGNIITSNGKQLTGVVQFNGVGGSWSLADDFYLAGSGNTGGGAIGGILLFTAGTFTANNKNVTAFNVSISGSTARNITMGTGTWTLNGTNNVWDATTTTNLTLNSTGSTIAITSPQYLKKTFIGGNLTYGTLNFNTTLGYVDLTLTGSNTFSTLSSTGPNKYLVTLTASGTILATNYSLNDAGAIKSSFDGSQVVLHVISGGAVSTTGVKYSDILIGSSGTWTANSSVLFNTGNITAGANVAYGVLLTTGTTWTVPANWNASLPNFVYIFGGGGGGSGSALSGSAVAGGAGGGGGGFTLVQNYSTTAGSSVTYSIGAGGLAGAAGGTSSTGGAGGNTTFASGTYSAGGGLGGVVNAATPISTGGAGGTGTTYNGGTGGNGATNATTVNVGTGGGGGAGGLLGVGGNGGTTTTTSVQWGASGGGNGGGSNGQGNVANPAGGNNIYGFGGGVASTGATSGAQAQVVFVNSGVAGGGSSSTVNGYAGNGGNGIDVYDIFGGGGGSAGWANNSVPTSTGGLFGGGGGGGPRFGANQAGQRGGQGGIVIIYNIPAVTNNNNYMIMF